MCTAQVGIAAVHLLRLGCVAAAYLLRTCCGGCGDGGCSGGGGDQFANRCAPVCRRAMLLSLPLLCTSSHSSHSRH